MLNYRRLLIRWGLFVGCSVGANFHVAGARRDQGLGEISRQVWAMALQAQKPEGGVTDRIHVKLVSVMRPHRILVQPAALIHVAVAAFACGLLAGGLAAVQQGLAVTYGCLASAVCVGTCTTRGAECGTGRLVAGADWEAQRRQCQGQPEST